MSKIKIEIQAERRQFEVANYLLKQAVMALETNPKKMKEFNLTKADLKGCEKFRQLIVSSFINNSPA
jgi:hypothetical protein